MAGTPADMMALITSIRHPRNSNSYDRVSELAGITLRSVCAQTDPHYVVIVVSNEPPRIEAPDQVHFVTVDFPAPSPVRKPTTGIEAIRIDRGAKYLVGLLYARRFKPRHIMFFDADDYLSRELVRFVRNDTASRNWYLQTGYEHQFGTRTVRLKYDFHKACGTSHIYRGDLFELPPSLDVDTSFETILETVDTHYLKHVLGSHRLALRYHARAGHRFFPLPFPAAVWVLGTGENHSGRSATPGDTPLDEELIREFSIPVHIATPST